MPHDFLFFDTLSNSFLNVSTVFLSSTIFALSAGEMVSPPPMLALVTVVDPVKSTSPDGSLINSIA